MNLNDKTRTIKRLVTEFDGKEAKTPILMGLKWVAVESKGVDGQVARLARDSAAKSFASVKTVSGTGTAAGLYIPKPIEEGISLPKSCVSAAAAFAETVGKESPDATLVLSLPEGKTYIISLQDGVPVADHVDSDGTGVEQSVRYASVIYADDDVRYGGCVKIDFGWLLDAASHSRNAQVRKVPIDPRAVAGVFVVGVIAMAVTFGGFFYYKQKEAERIAREEAAARAAAPGPKYTKALFLAKQTMMNHSSEWLRVYDQIKQAKVTVPGGWIRKKVHCTASGCSSTWDRRGGTSTELGAVLSVSGLPESIAPVIAVQMDAATTTAATKPTPGPYTGELVDVTTWLNASAPIFQNWKTAKFTTSIGVAELWPTVPDVPKTYRGPDTMGVSAITVTFPGVFLPEVLAQTPPNVSWNSVLLDLKSEGDAKDRISVTMTGVIYVSLAQ